MREADGRNCASVSKKLLKLICVTYYPSHFQSATPRQPNDKTTNTQYKPGTPPIAVYLFACAPA